MEFFNIEMGSELMAKTRIQHLEDIHETFKMRLMSTIGNAVLRKQNVQCEVLNKQNPIRR